MMRSRPRYWAALVALAAMLFAQAAFALAVCDPVREMSRAQMIAAPEAENANCHEPTQDANLCLAHCQAGEQTLDKHQAKVPDAPLHPLQVAQPSHDVSPRVHFVLRAPSPAAGPPLHIRFRSLLI
jgi:hypothetical protein